MILLHNLQKRTANKWDTGEDEEEELSNLPDIDEIEVREEERTSPLLD